MTHPVPDAAPRPAPAAPRPASDLDFASPGPWHTPAAYWFWHRVPTAAEIAEQVAAMADAGIRSFQIQARLAMAAEDYLSPAYLAACRLAVEQAATRGMLVGLYDDYNWQSGHAAGRAVAGHPELRERMLMWTRGRPGEPLTVTGIETSAASLGAPGMAWHYEDGTLRWEDWRVEVVLARTGDRLTDVTAGAEVRGDEAGCAVVVDAGGADEVVAFVSARSATARMVNLMDPVAVDRFVETGYQPYADALGEHLGTTVGYLFFDQPHTNFHVWRERRGDLRSAAPWADDLTALVRARWPEDHLAVLLALLDDDVEHAHARRAAFYGFYSGLAMERFLGTVHRWTGAHGLALSGHEVLPHVGGWSPDTAFGDWDLRVDFGLDHFGVDRYRDLTGVDAQDSDPQLSAKLGDSVARASGRSGVILEQYYGNAVAGAGAYSGHWNLTLAELRAQAIRHHLLGMRQLLFHGFYLTDGEPEPVEMFVNPRFDFPPGINFEPWFAPFHDAFAAESGRLSVFLDGAEPVADVAVLYPLRTVWAHGQGGAHARHLGGWARALATAGVGYHLVDEHELATASVEPGALVLGERRFAVLVLPAVRVLRSAATLALLRRAAEAGVRIVASGPTPDTYQEPGPVGADWATLVRTGRVTGTDEPDLAALGPDAPARAPVVDGGRLWQGREPGGAWRVVAFNDTDGPLSLAVGGEGARERWDPRDGSVTAAGPGPIDLAPHELVLLRLPAPAGAAAHRPTVTLTPTGPAPAAWRELADGWTLTTPTDPAPRPVAVTRGWEHHPGLDRYSGEGRYSRDLPDGDLELKLPAVAGSVIVEVDGAEVARLGWPPFRVVLPAATGAPRTLTLRVFSAAGNHYYAGTGMRTAPEPAGLLAPPRVRTTGKEAGC